MAELNSGHADFSRISRRISVGQVGNLRRTGSPPVLNYTSAAGIYLDAPGAVAGNVHDWPGGLPTRPTIMQHWMPGVLPCLN